MKLCRMILENLRGCFAANSGTLFNDLPPFDACWRGVVAFKFYLKDFLDALSAV